MNDIRTSRLIRRTLVWAAVVTLLAYAGRMTIIDGTALSMVWPAAGAAMLWFGRSPARWWPVDALALALVTGWVNYATGAPWRMVPVFVVANLVQVLVAVVILRQVAPGLWVVGGPSRLRATGDLWSLSIAAFGGSFLGASAGSVGMMLVIDGWALEDFLAWWGRNGAGSVAVVALVLLSTGLIDALSGRAPLQQKLRAALRVASDACRSLAPQRVELGALFLFTAALYWVAFVRYGNLPVAFPLMIATVWAGLRFDAWLVHLHALAVSTSVVVLSLNGLGPFAHVGDVHIEAMLSQLFVGLTIIFGLALALGRGERLLLLAELARAERTASGQSRQLSTLLDQMSDGVTLMAEDGTVVLRNPAGQQMLGVLAQRSNAINDHGAYELLTVELQPIADDDWPFRRAMTSGEPVTQDLVLRRTDADAADQVFQVVVTPFDGVDGSRQALVVYRDVTAERSHLRSVESFASVVAHDLNTPLAVIDGWTNELLVLAGEADQVSAREAIPMLDRVQRAAGTMRDLIRDLLAFSRARDASLQPEVVDLTDLARSVAQLRRDGATGEPPRIQVEDLPLAHVEPALVQQVFDNLIGNAVKYTRDHEPAEVIVSGRRIGHWVEVTVSDRGVGIPLEARPHVFEAFFRAHATTYQGHGLGLAICQRIVDRYGGNIRVEGGPGGSGTAFVFTLPAPPDVRLEETQHPVLSSRT